LIDVALPGIFDEHTQIPYVGLKGLKAAGEGEEGWRGVERAENLIRMEKSGRRGEKMSLQIKYTWIYMVEE
jgi:hypothetical protein